MGLGRYCRGLIEGIGRVDRTNRYEILMPDDSFRFPERPNIRYRLVRYPIFKRRVWEQMTPFVAGVHDLLHFPYDSCVAWKRAKFVTTVHDVKPLLFPVLAQRSNVNSLVEDALIGNKWARIDHVVTDSLCSKRDIMMHLKVPENRLTVVYPGIDLDRFCPAKKRSTFDVRSFTSSDQITSNLEPRTSSVRPYILSVAGADPTKNVATLVEAFGRLPQPMRDAHDLVLVGDFRRRPELRERAAFLGIEKQTIFPGIVDDDRLIELYQQAALFVFPSRYEGFGLPVLEAVACGCPVISSNASSLPEVAGDAVLLVEPLDVAGLAKAMEQVLSDQDLSRDLRVRGPARAAQFSWDRTAREMVAVYKKVVEG
ncbi:MAG: glycosyltransferase family 4 protein [Nitrospiraceae bacterium]